MITGPYQTLMENRILIGWISAFIPCENGESRAMYMQDNDLSYEKGIEIPAVHDIAI